MPLTLDVTDGEGTYRAGMRGGIRAMRCTYDISGKVFNEEIGVSTGMLSKHFQGRMRIRIGAWALSMDVNNVDEKAIKEGKKL